MACCESSRPVSLHRHIGILPSSASLSSQEPSSSNTAARSRRRSDPDRIQKSQPTLNTRCNADRNRNAYFCSRRQGRLRSCPRIGPRTVSSLNSSFFLHPSSFPRRDRPHRCARLRGGAHGQNYRAARALMGKGNSELRNSSRARSVRERGSSAKKGAKKSAVKNHAAMR